MIVFDDTEVAPVLLNTHADVTCSTTNGDSINEKVAPTFLDT